MYQLFMNESFWQFQIHEIANNFLIFFIETVYYITYFLCFIHALFFHEKFAWQRLLQCFTCLLSMRLFLKQLSTSPDCNHYFFFFCRKFSILLVKKYFLWSIFILHVHSPLRVRNARLRSWSWTASLVGGVCLDKSSSSIMYNSQ